MPSCPEYEEGVLASMIAFPDTVDDILAHEIDQQHFTDDFRKELFMTVVKMHKEGHFISELEVAEFLDIDREREGLLNDINYITSKIETTTQLSHWIEKVLGADLQRQYYRLSLKLYDLVDHPEWDEKIPKEISKIQLSDERDKPRSIDDIAKAVISELEHRNENRLKFSGISTGIPKIDALLGGLADTTVTVIAGRPGAGKTALGIQIGLNVAKQGIMSRYWSMEMLDEQLMSRQLTNLSGVNFRRAADGLLSEDDIDLIHQCRCVLRDWPIHIHDRAKLTISKIASQLRKDSNKHGNQGVHIIDYLQLLRPLDKTIPREQQIAEITRSLKSHCLDYRMPVCLLAQLNRNNEDTKEPMLSDLRESGAIEQDADNVILLWRHPEDGKLWAKVAKNRNGPTGKFVLDYDRTIQRIWS